MRRKFKRFIIRLRISNMEPIQCAGFTFTADFDSGNILKVELVNKKEKETARNTTTANNNQKPTAPSLMIDEPDFEFNIWTKPDCSGTSYENYNRTWFYFGIRGSTAHSLVKLNIVDLNKQTKMYSQGMVPVTKIVPGNKCNWERIRDRVTFVNDETTFILTFRYITPDNVKSTQYFAFTYPYTYAELQHSLINLDQKYLTIPPGPAHIDDIYYVRECVCKSLEGRRIDLITISSYHNITFEKEPHLKNLFPDIQTVNRPFKFFDKKVIFVSARVHPGETPASFVFNGFLNLLLNRDNIYSIVLRRLYVFKLIPFLNPDGVVHGHYRTDTKGVNLNRLYLNPSFTEHPSVYAARSIICYHHYGYEKPDDELVKFIESTSTESLSSTSTNCSTKIGKDTVKTVDCIKCNKKINVNKLNIDLTNGKVAERTTKLCDRCKNIKELQKGLVEHDDPINGEGDGNRDSGLFLYLDLHGHASKKGIFMYGNHFKDQYSNVECMLLPKIMSINNPNFHFYACNFTERNMYLKDKRDGLSREGSGRVAVLKLTGLIRSYTLECNYNTGRIVNPVPAPIREGSAKPITNNMVPPKFTPSVYEEAGRALGPSILDLTGDNPNSRVPNSEFRTLSNIREWLKWYLIGQLGSPSENAKSLSQIQRTGSRKSALKSLLKPNRIITCRHTVLSRKNDRKENVVIQNKINNNFQQTSSTSAPVIRPTNKVPARSKFTTPTIASNLKTKDTTTAGGNTQNLKIINSAQAQTQDDYNKYRRATSLKPSFANKSPDAVKSAENEQELLTKQETKRLRTSTTPRLSLTHPPHTYLNDKSRNTTNNTTNTTTDSATRMKLREICVLKTEFGKQYVATYDNPTTSSVVNKDNLIIEWKNNNPAKILPTKRPSKRPVEMAPRYVTKHHGPTKSDSTNVGGASSIKKIRVRKPLRRLATATELSFGLIKNKKRKKKKAKFI